MRTTQVAFSKTIKGIFITCIVCEKKKRIKPCHKGTAKYCSYKCYWENKHDIPWNKGMKGFLAGEKHWCFGKKRLDVTGKNNWKWNGGIKSYRKYIKEANLFKECVKCGEKDIGKLIVHHKDQNRYNNDFKNLMVLCNTCHCKEHNHFNRWGEYKNANKRSSV